MQWEVNALTSVTLQEIASELQGYSCDALIIMPVVDASDIICGGWNPDYATNTTNYDRNTVDDVNIGGIEKWWERCYCFHSWNGYALWSRCAVGTSDAALMFTTLIVLLLIATLRYFKTEDGWKIGAWRVEKVRTSDA